MRNVKYKNELIMFFYYYSQVCVKNVVLQYFSLVGSTSIDGQIFRLIRSLELVHEVLKDVCNPCRTLTVLLTLGDLCRGFG